MALGATWASCIGALTLDGFEFGLPEGCFVARQAAQLSISGRKTAIRRADTAGDLGIVHVP